MRLFKIDKRHEVLCEWKKTRMAFKHEATLLIDGRAVGNTIKVCYQNRTWERYQFESVLLKFSDYLEKENWPGEIIRKKFIKKIKTWF